MQLNNMCAPYNQTYPEIWQNEQQNYTYTKQI